MKDRSDDPSHHERTLLPRSYISLLGTRNSLMGLPWRIDPMTHRTMSERSYHGATARSLEREIAQWVCHEGSIRWPIAPWANALTTELHLAPWNRNSSMGLPWRIDPMTHRTMSERSYHGATSRSLEREIAQWVCHEGSIRRPIAPWANALTTELHLAPWNEK